YLTGFADSWKDGNSLGGTVSEYTLRYGSGETASTPILRRLPGPPGPGRSGARAVAPVPGPPGGNRRPRRRPAGGGRVRHHAVRDRRVPPRVGAGQRLRPALDLRAREPASRPADRGGGADSARRALRGLRDHADRARRASVAAGRAAQGATRA